MRHGDPNRALRDEAARVRKRQLLGASRAKERFNIAMVDDNSTERGKHTTVRFTDYAPAVFAELRSLALVSDQDYADAFALSGTLIEAGSAGKSGDVFYFTPAPARRFLVKTLPVHEVQALLKMLPDYLTHMRKMPHSLLSRYLGLHTLQLPFSQVI